MKNRGTVAAQHKWYFWKKSNFYKPQEIFSSQLITQHMVWHAAGKEVILYIDVNESIYTGPLAKALQGNRPWMEEQTLCLTGKEAPHSPFTGKVAIVGMYATPGIICTNLYLSPTWYKVARGALILQDAWLHGDFGFLAHTVLADQVLQGSYIYPKNMDAHTKLLLQEAQHIFHRLSKEEVVVDFFLDY
jgi:hypothetical protein